MNTIYALATPPGKSGVAVIRISGPEARDVFSAFGIKQIPKPRHATLTTIRDSRLSTLDSALVLWFPSPHSFTGEDSAELHIHGSRAIIQACFSVLGGLSGFRIAEPGEFSRRAFENGKMDLTEAEGLADLIEAETKEQHRLAMRQMQGELHQLAESWRRQLIDSMAFIEAYVDFPDENLPASVAEDFFGKIKKLSAEMKHHLDDNHRGERLREGAKIVILGAPNAGKSSLLNYLAKADLAIVSAIPGTTRDTLSVHLDIAGFPVTMIDTAGIRESNEPIEQEGIRRAIVSAEDADLRLVLLDGETYPNTTPEIAKYLDNSVIVITKSDLLITNNQQLTTISIKTGAGIPDLLAIIQRRLEELMRPGDSPAITRLRHRLHIEKSLESLKTLMDSPAPPEIQAELLRRAAEELSALTGRINVEDVLDHLFSQFCIGK